MSSYTDLKEKQQKAINAFPIGAAFSKTQFEEMMIKFGLNPTDTDKIFSLGAGCYIRKTDSKAFHELMTRLAKEKEDAIANDLTGDGYIFEMFDYELANHEYSYTDDLDDTLDALGLTIEEVNADERLKYGLQKALKCFED